MRGEIIKRPATLFERLGGKEAIPESIKRFCSKLKEDKKLMGYFVKTDMTKLHISLT